MSAKERVRKAVARNARKLMYLPFWLCPVLIRWATTEQRSNWRIRKGIKVAEKVTAATQTGIKRRWSLGSTNLRGKR